MFPLLLLTLGCNVDPAPEDVDALTHWFWQHFDDEDETVFAEGLENLHVALDADAIDG
ncbi:MAG: hypothetical protein JRI25_30070, partial [Deltaproteobacteria bacterium]|nr:hypothetical protein [Deltaproteobacteria bacterium]MBW2258804.1 hypothetical protein [Deltaproteobacteria bacterium]